MCDLAFLHDLTDEQARAVAHVESLLAQHFARLDARKREPFSPATAAATPGGVAAPSLPVVVVGESFLKEQAA